MFRKRRQKHIKKQMQKARDFIQKKRYVQAHNILRKVDHPLARKWQSKLPPKAGKWDVPYGFWTMILSVFGLIALFTFVGLSVPDEDPLPTATPTLAESLTPTPSPTITDTPTITPSPTITDTPTPMPTVPTATPRPTITPVTCPGFNFTCDQLTCAQARACLSAGNTGLDGDSDGIPCESQCGG